MSLYYLQKAIYELNRDPAALTTFRTDAGRWAVSYDLSEQERVALTQPDIGLLYVLGVNGQLLMHFAAANGYAWDRYLEAMRQGLAQHGQVRDGIYKSLEHPQ